MEPVRVTLTGGGTLVYNDVVMAGGGVTTDDRGIIFGANGLENFGLRGSLAFLYGDSFDDKNRNFVRDETEKYIDKDSNGKYTPGIGIVISNAGVSYAPATETTPYRLQVSGMGRLAFQQGDLDQYPKIGAYVDLSKDGIVIVDGRIQTFSLIVGGSLQVGGLDFLPVGKVGMRYQAEASQWDLFGTLDATIGKKGYGFSFGSSFDSPGIRWVNGSVTYVSAGITGEADLGGVNIKFTNAGLGWSAATETFAAFGTASVKAGVTVAVSLGTQANPGLLISKNNWELNGLELSISKLNISGFVIENAKIGFSKMGSEYSAWGSCIVTLNDTLSLDGSFAFANGVLSEIQVGVSGKLISIGSYFLINYASISMKNLDIDNLNNLTFTGTVGVQMSELEIDLTEVPLIGGKVKLAQFMGAATISPGFFSLKGDMYLGAIEKIVDGKKSYKGEIAQGTAELKLDWSKHEYYADVDMALLIPSVPPVLDAVFQGRITVDAGSDFGIRLRARSNVQIGEYIPLIGGFDFPSANLFLNFVPGKKQLDVVVWGEIDLLFWSESVGLHWDVWKNNWKVLADRDDVKSRLNSFGQQLSLGSQSYNAPVVSTNPVSAGPIKSNWALKAATVAATGYTYRDVSNPVPESEITSGEYLVHFRVDDTALRANYLSWINQIQLKVEAAPGVTLESIPASFNPATGLGLIGVKVLPLAGQYLSRGMTLKSILTSPVVLAGIDPAKPSYATAPEMQAVWQWAYGYTGQLPPVGTDVKGQAISRLNVTRVKYNIAFRPKAGAQLPADWLDSIRIYADPLFGTDLQVGLPTYDKSIDLWSVVLTYRPLGLTSIGSKFIAQGLTGGLTIRSKVELTGMQIDDLGGTDSPDISASWWAAPTEIEAPQLAQVLDTAARVTTISGRVHDPRFKRVSVSLYYSTDEAGLQQHITTRTDGTPAMDIPVDVQPDGSWSVDIQWDPGKVASGQLWLYGQVNDDGPNPPIYSISTPFRVRHDIQGFVSITPTWNFGQVAQRTPMAGLRVFVDLNDNNQEDDGEPVAITDTDGQYRIDLTGNPESARVLFILPELYTASMATPANRVVKLSGGQATADLELLPKQHILRGLVRVSGNVGQPVPGQIVEANGPGGILIRATTGMNGSFEIPVTISGNYNLKLADATGNFYGFKIQPKPMTRSTSVVAGLKSITDVGTLLVDSEAVVTDPGAIASGTLSKLIDQTDKGLISRIIFDESLRDTTLYVTGTMGRTDPAYMLWDSAKRQWTYVPEAPSLLPDGTFEESLPYGSTAFRIRENLVIDGQDRNITLHGDGLSRAFYVRAGSQFSLANLKLTNFAAKGSDGQAGVSGTSIQAIGAAGGGAGLGGAILNFGDTTLTNIEFISNQAIGGSGGQAILPAPFLALRKATLPGQPGGSPGGQGGQAGDGGGILGGNAGKPLPVILTYSTIDDPTPRTVELIIVAAGGGGSGLGGAIYNAPGANLKISGSTNFSNNLAKPGPAGNGITDFISNLANRIFGDSARTISVTGFETAHDSIARDGWHNGNAIFNEGGKVNLENLDLLISKNSVPENAQAGTLVGTLKVASQSLGQTTSFALVAGEGSADNPKFTIVGNQLRTSTVFDFEKRSHYSVRVRWLNDTGLSVERVLTIMIENVKEAPAIQIPVTVRIDSGRMTPLLLGDSVLGITDAIPSKRISLILRVDRGAILARPGMGVSISGNGRTRVLTGTISDINQYLASQIPMLFYRKSSNTTDLIELRITAIERYAGRVLRSHATTRLIQSIKTTRPIR